MNFNLKNILHKGETNTIEFKENFNNEVIETLVAFSNAKGGSIFIGITDKGIVNGVTINKESTIQWLNEIKTKTNPIIIPEIELIAFENKSIVKIVVPEYPIKPVATRGKYFIRLSNSNQLMSTADVVNMHLQTFNSSWDYHIDMYHSVNDISFEKVSFAIEKMIKNGYNISENPLQFLEKNDLIRDGKITHAAFLLFLKSESALTSIELGRFQSDIIIKP